MYFCVYVCIYTSVYASMLTKGTYMVARGQDQVSASITVVLSLRVETTFLAVYQISCISDIYIIVYNSSKIMVIHAVTTKIMLWWGVIPTWGTALKVRSIRKVEDHHFITFFICLETISLSTPELADLATVADFKLFNCSDTHLLLHSTSGTDWYHAHTWARVGQNYTP